MNRSERLIASYLAHVGYSEVVHEPDGNHPPDFLVDGRIAVEVRRLNQNIETADGTRGIETEFVTLVRLVQRVLASLDRPAHDGSWFLFYSFRRPLVQPWREFERRLTQSLANLDVQRIQDGVKVELMPNFRVSMYRAEPSYPTLFVFAGCSDSDSGGFVLGEIVRNVGICVAEKTRKVARVRAKYPEWWLALVDHIGSANLSEVELHHLRAAFEVEDPWQKIILVNPDDPTRAVTL
jgi:hypothetical protein